MFGTGIPCPCCGVKLNINMDFIISNPVAACPSCGSVMKFPVNDELLKEYKEAKLQIENIKRTIKNFK